MLGASSVPLLRLEMTPQSEQNIANHKRSDGDACRLQYICAEVDLVELSEPVNPAPWIEKNCRRHQPHDGDRCCGQLA